MEPLRAPRAALGQPKSSQELQEQLLASQEQRPFSKFDLDSIQTAADVTEKIRKTLRESAARSFSAIIYTLKRRKPCALEELVDLADLPDLVRGPHVGASRPHTPGVRMTGRCTNKLAQNIMSK